MGQSNLYSATQCLDTARHRNQDSGILPESRRSNWAVSQAHLELLETIPEQHKGRDGVSEPESHPVLALTLIMLLTRH